MSGTHKMKLPDPQGRVISALSRVERECLKLGHGHDLNALTAATLCMVETIADSNLDSLMTILDGIAIIAQERGAAIVAKLMGRPEEETLQ